MNALKAKIARTWIAGDFGQIAKFLSAVWTQNNQATDRTTAVEAEYLEVIATR
jgi:hypothetical protein